MAREQVTEKSAAGIDQSFVFGWRLMLDKRLEVIEHIVGMGGEIGQERVHHFLRDNGRSVPCRFFGVMGASPSRYDEGGTARRLAGRGTCAENLS
jgi:hypothetical protein